MKNKVTYNIWDATKVAHESVRSLWAAEILVNGTSVKIDDQTLYRVDFRSKGAAKTWSEKTSSLLQKILDLWE